MTERAIAPNDEDAGLVDRLVAWGDYSKEADLVHDGLRLVELTQRDERMRLAALRICPRRSSRKLAKLGRRR